MTATAIIAGAAVALGCLVAAQRPAWQGPARIVAAVTLAVVGVAMIVDGATRGG